MIIEESDLGFGTEYEKVIFSGILSGISQRYGIYSFCNYPKNYLLGQTHNVTGLLVETQESPDLIWNFCEFENEENTQKFFSNLEAHKPKYVLVVTQNRLNPGTLLHYLYHRVLGKRWDHGHLSKMTIKPIKRYLEINETYQILETGTFDAPWFILDVYEAGKYLKRLVPKSQSSPEKIKTSLFEHAPKIIKNWACHHNYILLRFNSADTK
jgi:hypothetical protein